MIVLEKNRADYFYTFYMSKNFTEQLLNRIKHSNFIQAYFNIHTYIHT